MRTESCASTIRGSFQLRRLDDLLQPSRITFSHSDGALIRKACVEILCNLLQKVGNVRRFCFNR